MYNYSVNADIVDATTPTTILFSNVRVKVTCKTIDDVISQIGIIFNVEDEQIKINSISYIQQVLTYEEEQTSE